MKKKSVKVVNEALSWLWFVFQIILSLPYLIIGLFFGVILLFTGNLKNIEFLESLLLLLGFLVFLIMPIFVILSSIKEKFNVLRSLDKKLPIFQLKWLRLLTISILIIIFIVFLILLKGYIGITPICTQDKTNYDKSCLVSEDCKLKYTGCCSTACINKEEVEEGKSSTYSLIPNVNALSCRAPTVACGCQNYQCVEIDYEDPPSAIDCSYISSDGERIKCYSNAASKFDDFNTCFNITNSESKNACLHKEALRKTEESICSFINDGQSYDNCLLEVAKLTLKYDTCNNIHESIVKDECVSFVAQNKNESTSCDDVKDKSEKNNCFSSIGKSLQNSALCQRITEPSKEDNCLSVVAQGTNDFELCKTIQGTREKDKCIAIVAQQTRTIEYCNFHSSLEDCHYFFYQEHCDLLGQDVDLNNYDKENLFVFKIMQGSSGKPYKCKEIAIRRHTCYPLDQNFYGECADEWRLYATTDSNGLVLANKSDFKLKDEIASVYQGHPRGYQYSLIIKSNNDQDLYGVSSWVYSGGYFRLENYEIKTTSAYFCKPRGTGWDCWDPNFDHLKTK